MQALGTTRPLLPIAPKFLRRFWRNASVSPRAFASFPPPRSSDVSADQSRGGLPRFYSPNLPSSKGNIVRVQDEEFWHMTKVLRLSINDRVELFDGAGGVVEGSIQRIDRTGLDFLAVKDLELVSRERVQWHVFAAFGSLKGGRADWLIEKCTELGASSVTPLLTKRSPIIADNRIDRLQRVSLAAVKQCQRLHGLTINPPLQFLNFLSIISQSQHAFLAAAGGIPLMNTLCSSSVEAGGLLIIGPEGDFTEEEVAMMTEAGATLVGLGPCRLRVETAAITLLATVMLWSASQEP